MIGTITRRAAIIFAAWMPFFVVWFVVALSYARDGFSVVLVASLISMGSAGLLGIPVWYACQRWPLPSDFRLGFYLLQILLAVAYGVAWSAAIHGLEFLRGISPPGFWSWASIARQTTMGMWFYAVFAGISYAVQMRNRLQEKEMLAARAEALASAARLDALRARLNPHFLFNALHTLGALVKFRPGMAETALERLGDMLRYTLKEDGRDLVEFSEEYDFTRQYLAFEQLRFEDRLKVELQVHPECFNFDVPPFSIQTLAENAVHHAVSIRPEGGSICINCLADDSLLTITVRDDGPGVGSDQVPSHQFGLRSLRERLAATFGGAADLRLDKAPSGFEATLVIPPANSPRLQWPKV